MLLGPTSGLTFRGTGTVYLYHCDAIEQFPPFASQFGFFLHLERFRSAALLDAPFGHSSRPAPALLNAVYLWSAHLSPVDALRSNETVFLNRALQQIAVQVPVHSAHIMHTIQAEILLSTYFFRENQPIEAECHLNGAISLVQSAGLHKIRSDGDFSSPGGRLVEPGSFLGPACDAIDESERINGFWTLRTIPRNLSEVCIFHAERSTHHGLSKKDMQDIHNNGISGHSTIEQFVNDLSPVAHPVFDSSSYPKAVVLLHAATRLYHRYTQGFKTDEAFTIFNAECFHFNCLITRFLRSLPPASMRDLLEEHTGSPILLVFTHVLVSCAYIQIRKVFSFSGFPNAFQDCVSAAQNIIHLLGDMNQLGLPHLCPIMGTFCTMACRVFGDELNNHNSSPALAATSDSRIDANILREYLEAGMSLMSIFAMDNPLMSKFAELDFVTATEETLQNFRCANSGVRTLSSDHLHSTL
ncbi:hypothetical protein D9757_004032 [Collybiopsis confluens]|uniref:Transcription factor domain-containing protein n=1 Tax=Collybiopsis confluens TaxID=2823264 RepID=A0A8H5MEG3_9AGAR|nr:hypothetical protein D9757_004032 [Collybiopsis confluens]